MEMATGIMIAMIDIGPSPGSMPMKVPIRQPADHHQQVLDRQGRLQADQKSFEHGQPPMKTRQRAQEDAKHLLHQIPDEEGGDQRDGHHDVPLALAQNERAEDQERRRRKQEPSGAQQQRIGHHQAEQAAAPGPG